MPPPTLTYFRSGNRFVFSNINLVVSIKTSLSFFFKFEPICWCKPTILTPYFEAILIVSYKSAEQMPNLLSGPPVITL